MKAKADQPAAFRGTVKPAVSIILPYYEGNQWLRRTVGSVQQQTERNWELIVVDDGSENPADAVIGDIDDARIRFLRIPHGGKGRALNRGVFECNGDHVCFIDQDDRMLPGRLETQLRAFKKEPHADGVYSDYERRHADGTLLDRFISRPVDPKKALHLMAVGRSPLSMQTLMVKKSTHEGIKGFSADPELTGLDDADFFVRLLLSGAYLAYEPGVVQCWVRHGRNYSGSLRFQTARQHWLKRLEYLAEEHPMLRKELKHFGFHAHSMRGLYFLENGQPGQAVAALRCALKLKPFSTNTVYLLLKAMLVHKFSTAEGHS